MGSSLRLDLIALTLSLLIHATLLSIPALNGLLSPKTYKVVDAVPISLDIKVNSQLLGIKSVKGKSKGKELRRENSITGGKSSRYRRESSTRSLSKVNRRGKVKKRALTGSRGRSGSLNFKGPLTGKGKERLSLSAELPKSGKSKELPSISYDRLVPYLLKVKRKIMENWSPPYYKSSNSKRTVIISLKVNRKGDIEEINIIKFSNDLTFNRSAIRAIYASEPFGKFPEGVKLKEVSLKVKFEAR
ncbi:energy transducer TonB [Thermovibrio sp.]